METVKDFVDWLDKESEDCDIIADGRYLNDLHTAHDFIHDYLKQGSEDDSLEEFRNWLGKECEDCDDYYFLNDASLVEELIHDFRKSKKEGDQ